MVTLCWAAKGGAGTTTLAATLALSSTRSSLLVDLAGEVPEVLGLDEPDRPGVADWLGGDGPPSQLVDLVIDVNDTTALLPCRSSSSVQRCDVDPERMRTLTRWLAAWEGRHDGQVWIDAGTGDPPGALVDSVDATWLVTRSCYLALRRAQRSPVRSTGIVLVVEPGRGLTRSDIERSLGVPVVATVSTDPKVARAVDAGLLATPPPMVIRRELRRAAA